ncbi:hypothetical protein BOX15_Mlig029689g1 [Macrostomum lignano]|uniref:WSC domain-containing protein n=1 Tax=Macrostomum lignano TaxID=282301 RepID=A0A267DA47_9PLAT|nr:hypothetical protein BOX15_Mlig029689g3 [Macrostomum lignano]PAA52415.1 hypothetical protein BOX15_Mlig029689g2 [Macrostomum lignano]PAA67890.1 hypothetical protein BOX15_Mlig029689g1 [Macrostomum lignano]
MVTRAIAFAVCVCFAVLFSAGDCCTSTVKKAIVVPKPKLIGCFKDEVLNRDFTEYGGLRINRMDAEQCQKLCTPLATTYMGIQGDECWCGNSFGKHGQGTERDCGQVCSGSMDEHCGGENFNSVYEVSPE